MKTLLILLTLLTLPTFGEEEKPKHIQLPSLPHLRLNLEERSVEVEAEVCLHEGLLELIACTKGSKEHESIIATRALPKHIHLMLVLLGAQPGNPHGRAALDDSGQRWRNVPARGNPVAVSLQYTNSDGKLVTRPIQDFVRNKEGQAIGAEHFLFAGSRMIHEGVQHPRYLADQSGHLITLSSFGDEQLCLPQRFSHENSTLQWQVHPQDLPEPGNAVTLILKPHIADATHRTASTTKPHRPIQDSEPNDK